MTKLNTPINYGEGEGLDDVEPGTDTSGRMVQISEGGIPLYAKGSKNRPGMTAPSLYPKGLGDPKYIAVFKDVAEAARDADGVLMDHNEKDQIIVHSGFLTPGNQAKRWQVLDATRSKKSPWEEILAGRFADSAGSVALPIDDDAFKTAYAEMKDDHALVAELSANGDPEALIKELIMYRANNGKLSSVKVDISTATSVHGLGRSVNAGLMDQDGELLNMGVGIDIPSPVQNVNFFENNGPKEFEAAIAEEPLLEEFLLSMGVRNIDEMLISSIKYNRRELLSAMRQAGFDFYRGEQGHFTLPAKDGNMPSREHAYAQARKFGYKVN